MKRPDSSLVVGSALGAVGAAAAAIFATLCCTGPAVVGLIGAGGALAAARLEPYRPYLLAFSVAMLAVGFWRSYGRATTGPDGRTCRIRTGRAIRLTLWAAALISLASILVPRLWS